MMDFKHWRVERDSEGIAWITFDRADARANTLSSAVLEELSQVVAALESDPPRSAVILSGKESGFIAGADVEELAGLADGASAMAFVRQGQTIFDRIEALPFPTVSLIQGYCLGGGLELALACRYRVAEESAGTRLGLPEVMLGIYPGWGGAKRLPPLTGPSAALDLMLTGRTVDGVRAKRLGLVDEAVPWRHLKHAARVLSLAPPPRRMPFSTIIQNHPLVRPLLAQLARRKLTARIRSDHYPAPFAIIDLWQLYDGDPLKVPDSSPGSIPSLLSGETARNLTRLFFLRERLKRREKDEKELSPAVHRVHVVGAGVMGGDIAAWCALCGFRVTLHDASPRQIASALRRGAELFKRRLREGRLTRAAMDRLIPDPRGDGVAGADIVIEAIVENVEAKHGLYRALEPRLKPETILATNTSSIPLETLGSCLADSSRLVGLHFFNPVARMQLVEVIGASHTDDKLLKRACDFVRRIDRLPLPAKSAPGFLVTRVLLPFLLEGMSLVSEGVPHQSVDALAIRFGMPMGPLELADRVGLDICVSVGGVLGSRVAADPPASLLQRVEAGQLGTKSGAGFYRYTQGKRMDGADGRQGLEGAGGDEIIDRLILSMLNEAVACLREGIVENGDLLDAAMVFGAGFAPFRGGPIQYIRRRGADGIVRRLEAFSRTVGARFTPDAGWADLIR